MKKSPNLSVGLVFDDSLDSSDGVAQYVKTLGAWLQSQGHDVAYLTGQTELKDWAGGRVYSLTRNIKVKFNGNRLSVPLPARRQPIARLLKEKKFDVIHVMMPHSPLLAQRIVNRADSRTAVIGTFHVYPSGWLAKAGGRLLRAWYGRGLRRFDRIVSVSPAARDYAKDIFGINSLVVPNMVDVSRFRRQAKPAGQKSIVFLGRLVERKGCLYLIRAFAAMSNQTARLVIAGDGPQRSRLEAEAKKLGAAGRMDFLGYIAESQKPELLAGAKIACFPSLYGESFGIVLIEAMAAGAGVVIGGDNPGYRSVLEERDELLVNPKDTTGFAAKLDEMLAPGNEADGLHKWQLETARRYDINVVGRQLLDIYCRQIARRTKKGNN